MLESRRNEGFSICLSCEVELFSATRSSWLKCAHKLSNAMGFNPVIPPPATETYSLQKNMKITARVYTTLTLIVH